MTHESIKESYSKLKNALIGLEYMAENSVTYVVSATSGTIDDDFSEGALIPIQKVIDMVKEELSRMEKRYNV